MDNLIVICVITAIVHYGGCCETGRIFIGSVNETYPDQIDKNGIYVQMSEHLDGFPIYKHESRDYYLYHVSGNILSSPYWLIGSNPGSLTATLSLQTSTASVHLAPEQWRIWSGAHRVWESDKHLKAICVDESFITCKTGKVRLHGLSPWNHHQLNRTGYYYLTNRTHDMRPVYRSEHRKDYLFYVDGLWMVGPEVGRVSAGMFVLDYAWRPEYITETWIVFNGKQFLRESKLKITCAGNNISGLSMTDRGDDDDDKSSLDADDVMMIAEGILQADDAVLPVCGTTYCENGGTCIKNEVNDFLCACPEFFFGARCERTVDCGAPPQIEHGKVVSQSGSGFHALAFYACADNHFMQGQSAVSCEETGEWSVPPHCVDWLDYINPGVNPTPARSTRQHFMTLSRHHRRHRRSLLPVNINKMKAMF